MDTQEQAHFDDLYSLHLRAIKLQDMNKATIDSYARAVRCVAGVVDSHSSSTVKIDSNARCDFLLRSLSITDKRIPASVSI